METEPHVLGLEEFSKLLDDQETNSTIDLDIRINKHLKWITFYWKQCSLRILNKEVEVKQDPVTEANQSNQVCFFKLITFFW